MIYEFCKIHKYDSVTFIKAKVVYKYLFDQMIYEFKQIYYDNNVKYNKNK